MLRAYLVVCIEGEKVRAGKSLARWNETIAQTCRAIRDRTFFASMKRLFLLLPGLLYAAETPEFVAEMHAWEAEMARPGTLAARDLPESVRHILALEPTERDEAQAATLADYFRKVRAGAQSDGDDRVAAARTVRGGTIRQRFGDAGLPYPPREVFLRAFKHEMELELWARDKDEPFRKIAIFPVTDRKSVV